MRSGIIIVLESINHKNLCIIPARGGSKGIKGKNLQLCGTKTLLEWAIQAAKSSELIDDIFCSTDSEDIAKEAIRLGVTSLPQRPENLASDTAKVLDVIRYTVNLLEATNKIQYDNIVLIQPSSPFVTKDHIDDSLRKLTTEKLDTVISAVRVEANHPSYMFSIENDEIIWLDEGQSSRRQELKPLYLRVGNFYTFKRSNIMNDAPSIYGKKVGFLEVENLTSITIDTPFDLKLARLITKLSEEI